MKLEEIENLSVKETTDIKNQLAMKTGALDCVPMKVMKESANVTEPLINTVTNRFLEQEFNEHWKKAIVRPLLKKAGVDMIPKNYCPISNLCYFSKVPKKSLLKRFMTHCHTLSSISIPTEQKL